MKLSSQRSALACLLASAALLVAVSCNRPPEPTNNSKSAQDAEVERRVRDELDRQRQAETDRLAAERLEAERKAQADREVEARVQARLAEERQREAQRTPPTTPAVPPPTPSAPIASTQEPLDDEDDAPDAPARSARPTGTALDPRAYRLFYEKLSRAGDGDWLETQNYGFVFQPRAAADPSWRPYTDGYWARTEAGWTWVSREPFGWATYHYGRWARLQGIGWVWTPGTTWAPAYVSWRVSADRRLVGWAPLPPEARVTAQRRREGGEGFGRWVDRTYDIGPENYAFIPASEFGEATYRQHVLPQERNVSIVEQSENVTRITYKAVENRTVIVNDGPDAAVLRRESRQPMRELRLERREEPATFFLRQPAGAGPGGITQVQGDRLIVATAAAAEIASAAIQAIRPPEIKRRVEAVPVNRGYGGLRDPQAIERVRGKIRSEGPPPPPEVERRAAAAQRGNRPAPAVAATLPAAPAVSTPSLPKPSSVPPPPTAATPPAPAPTPAPAPRTPEERAARQAARQAERARLGQPSAAPATSPAAAPSPGQAQAPKSDAEREAARAQRRAEREKAAQQQQPSPAPSPANLPPPATQSVKPVKSDAEREAARAQRQAERAKAQQSPPAAPSPASPSSSVAQ